jgi:putative transposase
VSCFRFIRAERANHSISLMCRVLGVSRSGFHAWERRPPSARALVDVRLTERIAEMHRRSRDSYGVRRIYLDLREEGVRVGRKRVARLMRAAGLSGYVKRRKGMTTIQVPGVWVADDLVERDFNPRAPNRLWASDIKYVSTWEGTLYLAAVIDCFSRRVVGWAMRDDLKAELVVDALAMAVSRRRPPAGLVHHSDRGSQYTSLAFGRTLRESELVASMGSRGDAYDNAACESCISTLKVEWIKRHRYRSRDEARLSIFRYVETFYNPRRRHSSLGGISPDEYEKRFQYSQRTKSIDTIETTRAA